MSSSKIAVEVRFANNVSWYENVTQLGYWCRQTEHPRAVEYRTIYEW